MADKNLPNYPSKINEATVAHTTFMRDVTEGTKKVQSKGETYLVKYELEEKEDYESRLNNSEVIPATSEAIISSVGKLLLQPTQLIDVHDSFNKDNIDNAGTSFDAFEHKLCNKQLRDGMDAILVDFPIVEGVETVEQKKAANAVPYYNLIESDRIINFRTQIINNETKLSQITILEASLEADGKFGSEEVTRYRVYYNEGGVVSYEVWIDKDNSGTPIIETEKRIIKGQTEIPITFLYGIEKAFGWGESPFKELAILNMTWYNTNSALNRTILRCSDPTPVYTGEVYRDDNGQIQTFSVGSSKAVLLATDADFKWVGAESDIIAPTFEKLEKLEKTMGEMATDSIDTTSDKTAFEVGVNNTDQKAKLTTWAINRENVLNQAYEYWCNFAGLPVEGEFITNKDFKLSIMSNEELKTLSELRAMEHITDEEFIKEAQAGQRLLTIEDIEAHKDLINDMA